MRHIFCGIVITCVLASSLHAQEQWENQGELEAVEIEIINKREITLPEANRNFEKIPPRPADPAVQQMEYDFRPFTFQAGHINPAVRPLKLKEGDPAKVYGGFVSAGYGNYASPYFEGFVNSKRDRNKLVGARALFSSSEKGPVDGKNSGSGLTKLSLFGNSFNENVSVSGDLGFENRTTHFYGYPQGTEADEKDIRQSYSIFRLKGGIGNTRKTDFTYNLGAEFSYLTDKYEARETEVGLAFGAGYAFNETDGLRIGASYSLISRKDSLVDLVPRSLFSVNPRYEFEPVENLKFSAGIVAAFENDTIDGKNIHAYPDLRASYPLTPSVQLIASLTGGIEKVSLQTLSSENIWIQSNIPVFHTNKLYDLQASLNTRLGNKVTLNGGFSFAALKNWYFFINDPAEQEKFLPVYDEEETLRTNFFGSLGFVQGDAVNVLLRADIYNYKTDLPEAWHRPAYKVSANASFNIVRKILLGLSLISQGGMKAPDPQDGTVIELDPALDANARVEYLVSDKFSVFVQMNNIAASEYPLYLNYPVRGFQVLGGLTWSF